MEIIHTLTVDGSLKIVQDSDFNNYTFDSLLLANFVKINKKTINIIDLCAGNGPITMLLSKKTNNKIIGVEYQERNIELAIKSISLNKLDDRVVMIHGNLIGINKEVGQNMYDLITCNPPYFKVNTESKVNETEQMTISRHEKLVTFEQIVLEVKTLMSNKGKFCFIHITERLDEIINILQKYNMSITRIRFIHKDVDTPSKRMMIEVKKGLNNKVEVLAPFITYNKNAKLTDLTEEIHKIK